MTEKTCESGFIVDGSCEAPASFDVAYVPPYLRGTATAAGTRRGVETHLHLCVDCYSVVEDDEWATLVDSP